MKAKRAFKDIFWPPLGTEQGRRDAIQYGAVAAGWIAVSELIGIVYLIATGQILFAEAAGDETTFVLAVVGHAVIAAIAAVLCWRVWRARSRTAAVLTLGLVLIEVVAKLVLAPGRGLVISAILAVAAIHGVRGTRAQARLGATGDTGG
jgi:hypothetical protein